MGLRTCNAVETVQKLHSRRFSCPLIGICIKILPCNALPFQTVEEGSFKASAKNKLLANRVAKMLNHSHKVLIQLESSLQQEMDSSADSSDKTDDV